MASILNSKTVLKH